MFQNLTSGEKLLDLWPYLLAATGIGVGIVTGFFKARRIQPGRFKWITFRNEAIFAAINLVVTGFTLGPLNSILRKKGFIVLNHATVSWWVVALEFAVYFVLFDTWFYWLHRGMHKEPFYKWIHKLHHRSTSPNLLTTFSVSPLESLVNGGFLPVFLTSATLIFGGAHDKSVALIVPFTIWMGLYVHSGHEFLPRWWNRTWATKWFITTTFHDQHHKYFNYNFGGYSQVWDYLCGTVRKKYETDFESPKGSRIDTAAAPADNPANSVARPESAPAGGALAAGTR
ncbi:sterol desaturase family protein [Novosphingobium sp.]|uniref:sterol desaturase family protein n=1 Tax=Novosphingobium sp. TaxID=1874826 RepID=UPI0025D787E9|nr:sterol desaturase family protein [Novosphingobium sp.]